MTGGAPDIPFFSLGILAIKIESVSYFKLRCYAAGRQARIDNDPRHCPSYFLNGELEWFSGWDQVDFALNHPEEAIE